MSNTPQIAKEYEYHLAFYNDSSGIHPHQFYYIMLLNISGLPVMSLKRQQTTFVKYFCNFINDPIKFMKD